MQPNFAFAPTSALEIIPKSRPTESLSSKKPSRNKCFSEPAYADSSHRSFKSSLREASQRQQDTGRSGPVDDDPVAAKRVDREVGPGKVEESATQAAAEKSGQADDGCEKSTTDSSDPQISGPAENEEGVENELAGSGAVTLTAPLTETADPSLSINSNSETPAPGVARGDTRPNITPGDVAAGGFGVGSHGQKEALPGQNAGALESDPATRIMTPETEMVATDKSETMAPVKSAIGSEQAGSDAPKGFDEFVKFEQPAAQADKSTVSGPLDSGGASGVKAAATERLGDPLQALQQIPAEQGDAAQKTQAIKAAPAEDTAAIRTSEVSGEQQSVGRMQSDLLQGREGDAKNESVVVDEAAPKIAKLNPGGKDNAFMQHQDQNFERLMEPATATREKEAAPGALRTQTIDQIVNKAIYQLKNGLNSVRIDLKPEFLGQVRMEIVTVDQQVSIRIAAQLPAVKEMLENSLQQLKADLQQQGLEVDEIEVFVSTDSQQNAQNQKMKSDLLSQLKTSAGDDSEATSEPVPEKTPGLRSGNLTVDMFV